MAKRSTRYDEAIRRLQASGLPERWTLFYSRGIALERSGQWKPAEADLLHALELKPDQPLVLNYLGYSWIDRGENLERGLKMIEKAVELRPEDGYIVDSLGWAHYRLGDYASAVQYLEKAIELVPEDPTINDHLGRRLLAERPPDRGALSMAARIAVRAGERRDQADRGQARPRNRDPDSSRRRLSPGWRLTAFAPAKVNLYLHVIGRRSDGYHLLDSLVAFADIGDRITAAPATTLSLAVGGPEAASLVDLAAGQSGAARRPPARRPRRDGTGRRAASGEEPADRRRDRRWVERRGGGVAGARGAVAAVDRRSRRFAVLGARLGADVPACLSGRAVWVGGIGERIEPAADLPPAGIVLANPRQALPTAAVFAARRGAFGEAGRFASMPTDAAGLAQALVPRRNDLTDAAIDLVPEIGAVLARLERLPGALIARMSGSGATCFALFADRAAAEAARMVLAAAEPDWWCAAGGLIAGKGLCG